MDADAIKTVVKESDLFRDLDELEMELLRVKAGSRQFVEGDAIYRKGEEAGAIGLIVSGKVNVVAENGFVLRELGAGEVIGEVGTVSHGGKRSVTLTVSEPTELIEWQIEDIEASSPELLERLKDLAWKRLKYYSE